jgi:hypothetical protein
MTDGRRAFLNGETIWIGKQATLEELENAIWLREHPVRLLASAFHGGHADGFLIAAEEDITTEIIQKAIDEMKGENNVERQT